MKHILKADFHKLLKSKIIIVLLVLSIAFPLIINVFMGLLSHYSTDPITGLVSVSYLFATNFSPSNNLGIILLLITIVLFANDFSQFTIRNKIIAGHSKTHIYLSHLIINISLVFVMMAISGFISYLSSSILFGFSVSELVKVLQFAVIGFSGLGVIYALVTLLMFHFKGVPSVILITLGVIFGSLGLNFGIGALVSLNYLPFDPLFYVFPLVRLFSVLNSVDTSKWWLSLLVNLIHIGWMSGLGIHIAKKTDYK